MRPGSCTYGWSATQALLEDPGYPPDPSRKRTRSFARIRRRAGWAAVRRQLEQAVSLEPAVNAGFDRQFRYLSDPVPGTRRYAINDLTELAADDPRTERAGSGVGGLGASDAEVPETAREVQRRDNQEERRPCVDAVREADEPRGGRDAATDNVPGPKEARVAMPPVAVASATRSPINVIAH